MRVSMRGRVGVSVPVPVCVCECGAVRVQFTSAERCIIVCRRALVAVLLHVRVILLLRAGLRLCAGLRLRAGLRVSFFRTTGRKQQK